ncbi:MAG TPA: hypothetical protein PLY87_12440 [Planctomycetaceae bacterium]|nr:hypothetical protein [Planctomycetaceae bacterium]
MAPKLPVTIACSSVQVKEIVELPDKVTWVFMKGWNEKPAGARPRMRGCKQHDVNLIGNAIE